MDRSVDFAKLVKLSHLSLSHEEEESLRKDFCQITEFADTVASVSEISSPSEERICPLREDFPRPSLSRSEILAPAPRHRDGFFSVPAGMEDSEHD